MNLLEVRTVSHRFADGSFGLRDVSFSLASGELLLVAGRNGSGKTVLMKHLNGLLTPTSGEILLEGRSIHENLNETRRLIGLVFQDSDNQIVGQTVRDDIAFGPENLQLPDEEIRRRTEEAVETLGLGGLVDRQPHLLSGGEKRRLAIAGILAMRPKIIIFDEPFSGLDYPGTLQTLTEILKLRETGHTLIVITHEVEKILAHVNRIIIMDEGRIVGNGSPDSLIASLGQHGIRPPALDGRGLAGATWLSS